jgi:hypothetical protein
VSLIDNTRRRKQAAGKSLVSEGQTRNGFAQSIFKRGIGAPQIVDPGYRRPDSRRVLPAKISPDLGRRSVGQFLAQVHSDLARQCNGAGATLCFEFLDCQAEHVSNGLLD